jgi:hypothetical protein
VHGRDRLLQAFERARLAAVDVMAEMTPLGEPSEYVNLSPTTGPVPLMVPAHELHARPHFADAEVAAEPELADASPDNDEPALVGPDDTVVLLRGAAEYDDADSDVEHDGEGDDEGDGGIASVVALFRGEAGTVEIIELDVIELGDSDADDAGTVEAGTVEADAEGSEGEPKASVGDLFARLRAARADTVSLRPSVDESVADSDEPADAASEPEAEPEAEAEAEAEAVGDLEVVSDLELVGEELSVFQVSPTAPTVVVETDDSAFGRRDAELTPLIVASARKLKRVLADEQNDVLHVLRRKDPVRTLAALLPSEAEHVKRYAAAIDSELRSAALAGAASVDDGDKGDHLKSVNRHKALQPAVDALLATVIVPLRERLERAVTDADGDNGELADTVRAVYREWKTQRIDEHLDDVARMAFGRGALVALAPGTPVCWAVDPNGPACPDAEDNALAGVIGAGQPFPTDHTCAPAHEGCRCMLQHAHL